MKLSEEAKLTKVGQVLVKFSWDELKRPKLRKSFIALLKNDYSENEVAGMIRRMEATGVIPKIEKNGNR